MDQDFAGILEGVYQAARLRAQRRAVFEEAVAASSLSVYFAKIRAIHESNAPAVARGEYDAYLVDWGRIFTPIEDDAWWTIRENGLRMFPQYPVGPYFVDFGDPWAKRAIECDGKAFHDYRRDQVRDLALEELGWEVLHIPGSRLVMLDESPYSGDHIIREWLGLPRRSLTIEEWREKESQR